MNEPQPDKRIAGLLAPVTALRGTNDQGVGDVAALTEFAGWAARKGFGLVQVLPVNETGADHSPYNILSSMALEPSTIACDPSWLPEISQDEFDSLCAKHNVAALRDGPVNYKAAKALKWDLLRAAFRVFRSRKVLPVRKRAFAKFETVEADWLEPYALFRALVEWNGTEVTDNWPEEHRTLEAARDWQASLGKEDSKRLADLLRFYSYVQWVARVQWRTARAACERLGVALMGDIPVGVSLYSADVWAEPGIFDITRSSGAPPERVFKSDPFTEKWGQNWGFPLYNWHAMAGDNFAWWRRRLRAAREVFDFLRVDHALGFFRIYSFPWRPQDNARFTDLTPEQAMEITGGRLPGFVERDDSSEENRDLNRLQGEVLLGVFVAETGPHRLIAEDLGEVAPYVRPVLAAMEIPGFKIPQWERGFDGRIIPGADYPRLSLATFATHDHPPIRQFWEDLFAQTSDPSRRDGAVHAMWEFMDFCGGPTDALPCGFTPDIHAAFVKGLFATNSWLAVHQITDLFGLAERFNVPGAVGDQNWTTRIPGTPADWDGLFPDEIARAAAAMKETNRAGDGPVNT